MKLLIVIMLSVVLTSGCQNVVGHNHVSQELRTIWKLCKDAGAKSAFFAQQEHYLQLSCRWER